MFVGAGPLPLLRRLTLQRLQSPLDGDRFGERKILPEAVLGELTAHHGVEVNDGDRHLRPAERPSRLQASLAGDQRAVGTDYDGMQQTDVGDAGGQRFDIT